MKEGFVAEILRAAGTLRSGDPAGATDIIRAALAAGGLATPSEPPRMRARGLLDASGRSDRPARRQTGRQTALRRSR